MTATLYAPRKRPSSLATYGYRGYICPTSLLRDFMVKHQADFQSLYAYNDLAFHSRQDEYGWREALAQEVAATLHLHPQAITRRIWGVMNNEYKGTKIELAEAICMSVSLDLDRDTEIPTLPGNMRNAKDLLTIRAEAHEVELDRVSLQRLSRQLLRISNLVINYPHHHQRLTALAPFNCLRPHE